MRALVLTMAFSAAATAASAQGLLGLQLQHDAQLETHQDRSRQREVELTNRLSTLDARLSADQAIASTPGLRPLPPPVIAYNPSAQPDATQFISIPDDRLAASNARVREAAANSR